MTIVLAAAVIAAASAAQAITGFGSALLAVPFLTIIAGPRPAVVAGLMVAVLLSIGVAVAERRHVLWRPVLLMGGSGVVAAPVGLLLLRTLSDRDLTVLICGVLLLSAVMMTVRIRLPATDSTMISAGLLSGVLLTSTGLNGPPLAVALAAQAQPPRTSRATLSMVFVVHGFVGNILVLASVQVTSSTLTIGAVAVPAMILGWVAGDRVSRRMDQTWTRRAVIALLVVGAVLAAAIA
ncbi:sulfite exporter TauE/SafE family protein [Dactylosporangium sp. NPDC051484]|uniref:sulfite exporter TauE/SafE family protein n=1 Tax=Dactylosporangium sp. NPDC051484 TaxID=3154942 RepID=UPI0034502777